MGENAELWCTPGNERRVLVNWLESHDIIYNDDMTTEELTQLYRDVECGVYGVKVSTYKGAIMQKLNLDKADKLFNKLGYKKAVDEFYLISYEKSGSRYTSAVRFLLKDKNVTTELIIDDEVYKLAMSMDLLKAITAKCIELNWL